jgi:hypothetical protein
MEQTLKPFSSLMFTTGPRLQAKEVRVLTTTGRFVNTKQEGTCLVFIPRAMGLT